MSEIGESLVEAMQRTIRDAVSIARERLRGHRGPLDELGRDGYLSLFNSDIPEVIGIVGQEDDD